MQIRIKNFFQKIERIIFDILHFFRKKIYKIYGKKTFGVRAIIIQKNKILLVKHRYGDLWVMPGGKISYKYVLSKKDLLEFSFKKNFDLNSNYFSREKNTLYFNLEKKELFSKLAIINELKQEVGLKVKDNLEILGTYENISGGKNDQVTVFIVKKIEKIKNYKKRFIDILEIKEVCWFDLNNLPDNTSSATKKRILEFLSGKKNLKSLW